MTGILIYIHILSNIPIPPANPDTWTPYFKWKILKEISRLCIQWVIDSCDIEKAISGSISWRQSIDVRPLNSFMTSSTGVSSNPGIIWLYGYKCRTVTSYKILAVSDFLFGYSVIRRDYRYFIGISNSVSVFDSMNLLAAWSIYVPGSIGRFKIRNILVQGILRKCF